MVGLSAALPSPDGGLDRGRVFTGLASRSSEASSTPVSTAACSSFASTVARNRVMAGRKVNARAGAANGILKPESRERVPRKPAWKEG